MIPAIVQDSAAPACDEPPLLVIVTTWLAIAVANAPSMVEHVPPEAALTSYGAPKVTFIFPSAGISVVVVTVTVTVPAGPTTKVAGSTLVEANAAAIATWLIENNIVERPIMVMLADAITRLNVFFIFWKKLMKYKNMIFEKITEEQFSTGHAQNGTTKLRKCCHNLFIFLGLDLY